MVGVGEVVALFVCTSLLMWTLPLWLLYAFNNKLVPGSETLSSSSLTLWSGLLAVLSVNLVIVGYIFLALREKPMLHSPDPAFLSKAKASISNSNNNNSNSSNISNSNSKMQPGRRRRSLQDATARCNLEASSSPSTRADSSQQTSDNNSSSSSKSDD